MIVDEINQQSSSMDEGESTQTNSSSKNSDIKSNLTLIKKSEECSSNYFEETESLKYNSSYKAAMPDSQNNNYRKSSTLSTNVSQSDFQLDISPKKSFNECSSSSLINFSRERFSSTPLSNYYDGTDNYFKGLYPENNNYQKSNNYLEKKLFFREHYPSVDLDIIYKEREKLNYSNDFSNNQSTMLNINNTPSSQNSKNFSNTPLYCVTYPGIDRKLQNILIFKY